MTTRNFLLIFATAFTVLFSFDMPSYAQCTKDTDCRGNRICDYDSGRCVVNEEDDPPRERRRSEPNRRTHSDDEREDGRMARRCCDVMGRPWCAQTLNPGRVGEPCWCAGLPGIGQGC